MSLGVLGIGTEERCAGSRSRRLSDCRFPAGADRTPSGSWTDGPSRSSSRRPTRSRTSCWTLDLETGERTRRISADRGLREEGLSLEEKLRRERLRAAGARRHELQVGAGGRRCWSRSGAHCGSTGSERGDRDRQGAARGRARARRGRPRSRALAATAAGSRSCGTPSCASPTWRPAGSRVTSGARGHRADPRPRRLRRAGGDAAVGRVLVVERRGAHRVHRGRRDAHPDPAHPLRGQGRRRRGRTTGTRSPAPRTRGCRLFVVPSRPAGLPSRWTSARLEYLARVALDAGRRAGGPAPGPPPAALLAPSASIPATGRGAGRARRGEPDVRGAPRPVPLRCPTAGSCGARSATAFLHLYRVGPTARSRPITSGEWVVDEICRGRRGQRSPVVHRLADGPTETPPVRVSLDGGPDPSGSPTSPARTRS